MLTKSGIIGFDNLVYGGLIKNSTILVEGVPGAGKTTFGLEFIYKGIVEMNEPGVVITFEELPEQLYRDAGNFGWNLRKLEEQNLLRIICTSPDVILDNSIDFLRSTVEEVKAKRLLLDSVTQLNMELSDIADLRKSVYSLCSGLKRTGLTSVLIKEIEDNSSFKATFEEFVVDTVIRLYFQESFRYRRRYLEVLKSRGQDFVSGKNPFKFGAKGLEIINFDLPKIPKPESFTEIKKCSTGIEGLDNILDGGFIKNSTIMVEGTTGTGKSVMGIHFLLEGTGQGEKGLLLATEESTNLVTQYFSSFDISPDKVLHNDNILIVDRVTSCISAEEVISDLIKIVEQNQIQRVVIDFVNTFVELSENLLVLKSILRDMINYLNRLGCTTILILNDDEYGEFSSLKNIIKPLVQGEIYLSSLIRNGRRYRSLEVNKMKGQRYISGRHLAEISKSGMFVYQRLGGL